MSILVSSFVSIFCFRQIQIKLFLFVCWWFFFFKCCMQIQFFSLKFTHFVTRLIFFTIDLLEYIVNFLCRFSCFLIEWIFSLLMFFSVMPIYTELKIYVLMCCNTKTRETIPFSLCFFYKFCFWSDLGETKQILKIFLFKFSEYILKVEK